MQQNNSLSLFYGPNSEISQVLVSVLKNELFIISDDKWENKKRVTTNSTKILTKLKEKVSSSLVYLTDKKNIKHLDPIITKTHKDGGRTVILLDAKNINLANQINKSILDIPNVALVVLGDVFGPSLSMSNLSKIFQIAKGTGEIEVEYGREHPLAIISENDLVTGLERVISSAKYKILIFAYTSPPTLHTAVLELVKKYPDTKLTYGKHPGISTINQKELTKKLTVHFGKKPIFLDYTEGFVKSLDRLPPKSENIPKKRNKKNTSLKFKRPALLALSSLLFFYFTLGIFAGAGLINLNKANASLTKHDITSTKLFLEKANIYFTLASPLKNIVEVLPLEDNVKNVILSGTDTISLAKSTLEEIDSAIRYQNFHNGQQAIAHLTYAYFKLSQNNHLFSKTSSVLGEGTSKIASILQSYPDIVGENNEKKYLLLFQNNAELRPNGGFIGSVGELSLKDGKISDLVIRDVYELDGQLREHIEPHYVIRRNLQPHLYLRDSNFDIEFDTSAQKAALIYKLQTGKEVDGIIALDFEVIKTILKQTGKVTLPDHNLTIDENTAQSLIQDTVQDNFFPGSTKKKDVLQSLMTKLLLQLEDNPSISAAVAKELPKLLDEKHILFSFQDSNLQKLFSANNYTGSINDRRKQTNNSRNDIHGIVEANIGVNKANNNLQRRVEYDVYLGEKSIISKSTLHIFNTGTKAENYKAYVRVIAPKSSKLETISIDGADQTIIPAITDPTIFEARTYIPPLGLEIDEKEEEEYKTFGFVTTVKKGRSQKITVIYSSGLSHSTQNTLHYSLMFIKQPGTPELPISVKLNYPENFSATSINLKNQKGSSVFSGTITKDTEFKVTLEK